MKLVNVKCLPLLIKISVLMMVSLCWLMEVYAVDASRIWLPKKYNTVKPKLLAAAIEAEKSERCMKVVAGEMIVGKNTADNYYFVITCRDSNYKTYNLSYLYPVAGNTPDLIAEQRSKEEKKKAEIVEVDETGVNQQQALQLCKNHIPDVADMLDDIELSEDIQQLVSSAGVYTYQIPLIAKSELGNDISYRADCRVSPQGETNINIKLESDGALALCRDNVRAEAILYGRIHIDEGLVKKISLDGDDGFHYQLPFDVKNRIGTIIRYSSECTVNSEWEVDIKLELVAAGALATCKDNLLAETLLLKSVLVAEQASVESVAVTAEGQRFSFEIPFTANDQEGNQRNFKAFCEVNEEGEADVFTEIDKGAIIAVCISELKKSTAKMKEVVVLDDQLPPLQQQEDDSYMGIIPFDAKNPGGRILHYVAECRVDGNGKSSIKLKARKKAL